MAGNCEVDIRGRSSLSPKHLKTERQVPCTHYIFHRHHLLSVPSNIAVFGHNQKQNRPVCTLDHGISLREDRSGFTFTHARAHRHTTHLHIQRRGVTPERPEGVLCVCSRVLLCVGGGGRLFLSAERPLLARGGPSHPQKTPTGRVCATAG